MSASEEKAKRVALDILALVNSYGVDSKTFAKTICEGHRTLQQSTMRLFMEVIREMANNSYDDRNEASVEMAKKIIEATKDCSLPFI